MDRPEEVIAIPVGGSPLDLGIADSGLWVTVGTADQQGAYHLAEIDPVSNELVDSVELEDAHAVVASEAVWVTQTWRDTVIRLDPAEAQPTVNIPLPPLEPETLLGGVDPCFGPGDLSLGEGGLWVDGRGAVARIDVASDQVVAVISPPAAETAKGAEVLAAIGSVWLTSNGQYLWRVDPKSNTWAGGLAIAPNAGHSVNSVATVSGRLWVSGADLERDAQGNVTNVLSPDGSGLSEVDPADGSVVRTVHFDESNLMIASDGIERLVAWEQGVGLWLIDEADELPKKRWVCSPAEVSAIAVDDEIVWVAIFDAGEVWRIDLQASGMSCPAG